MNGWLLTQAKRVNVARSGEAAKFKWVGNYIYCSANGYRIDTTGEDGLFTIAKAPDWTVYSCCSKNKTYTRGLQSLGGPPASETDVIGDERRCYTVNQVKGPSPTIAGFKTKHYAKYYHPYAGSNGCIYQGTYFKDLPELSSEWFTADPKYLPAALKTVAKSWGRAELSLRRYSVVIGHASGKKYSSDGSYDSAKRLYTITDRRVIDHKVLDFDTSSWKRAFVPSTAFEVPTGYRYLPPLEFAKQLMPAWILELDRNNPKEKRVFPN